MQREFIFLVFDELWPERNLNSRTTHVLRCLFKTFRSSSDRLMLEGFISSQAEHYSIHFPELFLLGNEWIRQQQSEAGRLTDKNLEQIYLGRFFVN